MSFAAFTRLIVAGFALALLGACVITSPTNLVTDAEAVTPLPASFSMFPYKHGPGGFIRADDDPMPYQLVGKTYQSGGKEMTIIRLAPLTADTYLLAATGKDPGTLYGTLTLTDGIAGIHMILPDKLKSVVADLTRDAPADITSDIVVDQGAITVTKRETLDWLIARIADGRLPTSHLVAWLGPADATPPAMITEDGGKLVAH